MTAAPHRRAVGAVLLLLALGGPALAQSWQQLTPQQRSALAPLEQEWAGIDDARKRKWLDVAQRMPGMSADERQRIQGRMSAWSRLSPDERGGARQRYQQSRGVDAEERQRRWEAYQALPAERRRELAGGSQSPRGELPEVSRDRKSSLVPNPAYVAPPRPVTPTVQQARPGATTTLITRPPAPPRHQQTGLPKIAVTPGFVDGNTLLPQRGPQAAAQSAPAASAPRARAR